MKSFYEMWVMMEGFVPRKLRGRTDYDAWLTSGYEDGYDTLPSFSRILGEGDAKSDFVVEVDVVEGEWEASGPIWVLDYVPNGSENPASEPVAYTAGQKDSRGIVSKLTGTEFMKPGQRLELLPASIREEAIKWVNREVEEAIKWHLEHPDYDSPDDQEEPYNPDSQP